MALGPFTVLYNPPSPLSVPEGFSLSWTESLPPLNSITLAASSLVTSILCLCKLELPTFQFWCSDLCYIWAKGIINVFSSRSFAYIFYSSIFNKMWCFLRWCCDHIPTPSTTLLSWVFSFCSYSESWGWRFAARWTPTFILQYFSLWVRLFLWT